MDSYLKGSAAVVLLLVAFSLSLWIKHTLDEPKGPPQGLFGGTIHLKLSDQYAISGSKVRIVGDESGHTCFFDEPVAITMWGDDGGE